MIERDVDFDAIAAALTAQDWPRLAQLVRREMMDGRNVVALARADELDIADELAALLRNERR